MPITEMTPEEFGLLRDLIQQKTGIQLHDSKQTMLANRLLGYLRARELRRFRDFYELAQSKDPKAVADLIDAVTTRKTEFFRFEIQHRFFETSLLDELLTRLRGGQSSVKIWSAGCASGEEACSIAISLLERLPEAYLNRAGIEATDVSPRAIESARAGCYKGKQLQKVPPELLARYFQPNGAGSYQVLPAVKRLIQYRVENLRDSHGVVTEFADVIFCRNVMIYFSEDFRRQRLDDFIRALRPGGFLLLGPSEMLLDRSAELDHVAPSVYRKGDS